MLFKRIVSELVWLLKHSLLQTLEAEIVGVGVDERLAGPRTHHLWLERCKWVRSTSLHGHLQLQ